MLHFGCVVHGYFSSLRILEGSPDQFSYIGFVAEPSNLYGPSGTYEVCYEIRMRREDL